MDNVDPGTRSRMMASVKGSDTLPELSVRRYFHACGLRFRLHDRRLPGRPDLILPARRLAVFVHGCFWHRHPGCRFATTPASRREFWEAKFGANVERDARVTKALSESGWAVSTIWECQTRDETMLDDFVWQILSVHPGPEVN